ncbi:GNAT family N-acetyltransferase [Kytococcus sedentarius]|uniref:GNAT family N-acetyltransferase n=1 Tax=Kytococcus sedentarius TaxID=1276 RepID=UPI0035BC14A8
MTEVTLSTDPARIDLDRVHHWLSTDTYWARGRSREKVEAAFAGSMVVGAYAADGTQVGVARIVTDRATFAWLCDVYVDPDHRGQGISHQLVEAVLAQTEPMGLSRIVLATGDAHGLYERYGFEQLPGSDTWMVRGKP